MARLRLGGALLRLAVATRKQRRRERLHAKAVETYRVSQLNNSIASNMKWGTVWRQPVAREVVRAGCGLAGRPPANPWEGGLGLYCGMGDALC